MLKEYGFVRVGAAVNKLKVADINYNVDEIINVLDEAIQKGIEIITFPELSLTGYTCYDLFLNDDLLDNTLKGLARLKEYSNNKDIVFIVGCPLKIGNVLYNCAVSINNGSIIGITPKSFIPNYNEFYEGRYFASANNLKINKINLLGEEILISNKLIYQANNYPNISYAIDICEDLWNANSPSNITSVLGATIIFNLSSSNELAGKSLYRRNLVAVQAAKTTSAYVYASSGMSESSSDLVFSGHLIIADDSNGVIENKRFSFESDLIYNDIDVLKIISDRRNKTNFDSLIFDDIIKTEFDLAKRDNTLLRKYSKTPFIYQSKADLEEILTIQSYGLARRVKHLNNARMVIGISGGADSTLAFLVCLRATKALNISPSNIIAITMPGFGTTNRTYYNAKKLIEAAGATFKEISIKDACLIHYRDIGQELNNFDVTYENAQARERTQILFDYANKVNGIVVGTGDLSEIALGWATYNGDHMSNYSINASIPKTLVTALIAHIRDTTEDLIIKETLNDILDTPISPELLPPDKDGNIVQSSEASVGPYILQDFFLYHFITYNASIKKIYYLATMTFNIEKEEIKKHLTTFIRRFFTQQFKRNCMPDGVKAINTGLSPRGDWKMPADASYNLYLEELERL